MRPVGQVVADVLVALGADAAEVLDRLVAAVAGGERRVAPRVFLREHVPRLHHGRPAYVGLADREIPRLASSDAQSGGDRSGHEEVGRRPVAVAGAFRVGHEAGHDAEYHVSGQQHVADSQLVFDPQVDLNPLGHAT